MKALRGLERVVEIELLLYEDPELVMHFCVDKIRRMAIKTLQASKCHKDCQCEYECGCAETGDCSHCDPPKRVLRIITARWTNREIPCRTIADAVTRVEEIRVSPQQVLSTRII
jgi:hypothetical protein